MISLLKHIDNHQAPVRATGLDAFHSSLLAMAECSQRAVPALGSHLNSKLNRIAASVVASHPDDDLLARATEEMRAELTAWADRALDRHNDNEREMREIISTVSETAVSISEDGSKYAKEIGELNTRLRGIADLRDVAVIRHSILESTHALRTCVEKMAADSKASVTRLTAEVNDYRTRLEESERVCVTDPLTGLANRRAFERKLDARIAAHQAFCIIMLDVDDFKAVNDTHGHLAGDDLLKQFASELERQFSPGDLVARWGGDEFAIIVAAPLTEATHRMERIRRWVLGEYKLTAVDPVVKVRANASAGVVQWNGQENGIQLLARADKEVYKSKATYPASSKVPGVRFP